MPSEAAPLVEPRYSPATGRRDDQDADASVSPAQLLRAVLRQRKLIARIVFVVLVLTAAAVLLRPRQYTVVTSFVPDSRRPGSNLSGIAAQLGVPVGSSDLTESPQFYADLVRSRELLRRAAVERYTSAGDSASLRPLTVVLGEGPPTDPGAVDRTIAWLGKRLSASPGAKTGVVTLTVTAPSAILAQELSTRFLALINQFNLETRQSRAAKERKFAEARIVELRVELRQAEDALAYFLARNRGDLRDVPDMAFQRDRLAREAQLRQTVYATMVQSFEQARLDEVRDTPVITIVDPPHLPLAPDSRGLVLKLVGALIGGLTAGGLLAILRDGFAGDLLDRQPDLEELRTLVRATLRDLRRPWGLLAPGRDPTARVL